MKSHIETKGNWMVAAAFAEAGEWETARSFIPEKKPVYEPSWLSKVFAAIAFAEEGLHEEAIRITGGVSKQVGNVFDELEDLGLTMIHLRYGTVYID